MKMKLMCSILVALSILFPLFVIASDDWPAWECLTNGKFDKDKCNSKASWIAVGTIKNIRLLSYPKNKPHSEFTLLITRWEKGDSKIKNRKELKYLEGYIEQIPQAENLIRIYGYERVKHLPEKEYGVFYIEQLNDKKE